MAAFPALKSGALGARPLFFVSVPGERGKAAVVEQSGIVYVLSNAREATTVATLIDISARVLRQGEEEGLLGLAFDPAFEENGHFYLYYSAPGPRRSVLSRFTVDPGTAAADPDSEQVLLEIEEPFPNHNGGGIAFGPDGYLYVGIGDGGSRADPFGNGQNPGTLLGTILRLDVGAASDERGYRIPADNPFVEKPGARPEVWAYGLRNPWRFSFDRETGELWVGDVGQNQWEEIDIVRPGANYGWNVMEGFHCFRTRDCDDAGLEPPIAEYDHSLGCSITGGYVYRGAEIPSLAGAYVYGDFCSGRIWALRYENGVVEENRQVALSDSPIASFGEDEAGELYAVTFGGGVFRLAERR